MDLFTCSVCGDVLGEPSQELGEQQYLDELRCDLSVCDEFIEEAEELAVRLESVSMCLNCGRIRCPSCDDWCCWIGCCWIG